MSKMGELIDIYDEFGNKMEVMDRNVAHIIGAWHKTTLIIVITPEGEIICIKRPHDTLVEPNKVDICGGHLKIGETYFSGAFRELKEELYIEGKEEWNEDEFIRIGEEGRFKCKFDDGKTKNHEFSTLYAYLLKKGEKYELREIHSKGFVRLQLKKMKIQELLEDFNKLSDEEKRVRYADGLRRVLENEEIMKKVEELIKKTLNFKKIW